MKKIACRSFICEIRQFKNMFEKQFGKSRELGNVGSLKFHYNILQMINNQMELLKIPNHFPLFSEFHYLFH